MSFLCLWTQNLFWRIFSVVKEEIGDDGAVLPCFNGRVVSWVCSYIFSNGHLFPEFICFQLLLLISLGYNL